MVTAGTITDEQIRELRASATSWAGRTHVEKLCELALVETDEARAVVALKPYRRKQARARCAELLNARSKEPR